MSIIFIPLPFFGGDSKEHVYRIVTPSGRNMKIRVDAGRDISDEAVREDILSSLDESAASSLEKDDAVSSPWEYLGFGAVAWFMIFALGLVFMILLDVSGLINSGTIYNNAPRWPEYLPSLLSGVSFWQGLLRLHIVVGLPLLIICPLIYGYIKAKSFKSMTGS